VAAPTDGNAGGAATQHNIPQPDPANAKWTFTLTSPAGDQYAATIVSDVRYDVSGTGKSVDAALSGIMDGQFAGSGPATNLVAGDSMALWPISFPDIVNEAFGIADPGSQLDLCQSTQGRTPGDGAWTAPTPMDTQGPNFLWCNTGEPQHAGDSIRSQTPLTGTGAGDSRTAAGAAAVRTAMSAAPTFYIARLGWGDSNRDATTCDLLLVPGQTPTAWIPRDPADPNNRACKVT
jgi:hypothetical protein